MPTSSTQVAQQVEYDVKYAGYVARQEMEVATCRRLPRSEFRRSFDYSSLLQLRIEAREKLTKVRPISLAQASRISGITPADVAILLVHLGGRVGVRFPQTPIWKSGHTGRIYVLRKVLVVRWLRRMDQS